MVLAHDLAQLRQRRRVPIVRPHPPGNASGGPLDDGDDVGLAAADHHVVGVEALVAGVEPLIRAQVGRGVDVQPVGALSFLAPVGITAQRLTRLGGESQLLHVVAGQPVPHDPAVPVHFHQAVVFERLVGDRRNGYVLVREHQGAAAVDEGQGARREDAGGAALPLPVMVLPGNPGLGAVVVGDAVAVVERPDDLAVPVHLDQPAGLLVRPSPLVAAHDEPARQQAHRRRHRRHLRPALHFTPVHVDDDGALLRRRAEDGVATPRLAGFVDGGAGRVDRRVALDERGNSDEDRETTEGAGHTGRHEPLPFWKGRAAGRRREDPAAT